MIDTRFWGLAALLLTTLTLTGCGGEKKAEPKAAAGGPPAAQSTFSAIVVHPVGLAEELEASGTLLAFEETELRPEVSGRVTEVRFREGSAVKAGEVLLRLFDDDLKAQLNKLKVQLQIAEKNEQRLRDLLKINGISQQEYDLASLQVSNIQADIELVKISLSKTELKAPFDGKIGLKNVSVGAYISPATSVATLRQVSRLKLDFTVPEKYAMAMQPGKKVVFQPDGQSKTFDATVLATESSVSENTRTLRVRAEVAGSHRELVPGLFARVKLPMQGNPNAILIPTQALIPTARDKKVVVRHNGKAEMRTVTTGIREASQVEITSGLSPGDTVMTTGIMFLKPNAPIKQVTIVE